MPSNGLYACSGKGRGTSFLISAVTSEHVGALQSPRTHHEMDVHACISCRQSAPSPLSSTQGRALQTARRSQWKSSLAAIDAPDTVSAADRIPTASRSPTTASRSPRRKSPNGNIAGKVVVITGASSGVGEATAGTSPNAVPRPSWARVASSPSTGPLHEAHRRSRCSSAGSRAGGPLRPGTDGRITGDEVLRLLARIALPSLPARVPNRCPLLPAGCSSVSSGPPSSANNQRIGPERSATRRSPGAKRRWRRERLDDAVLSAVVSMFYRAGRVAPRAGFEPATHGLTERVPIWALLRSTWRARARRSADRCRSRTVAVLVS